jgi:hypothetical protein
MSSHFSFALLTPREHNRWLAGIRAIDRYGANRIPRSELIVIGAVERITLEWANPAISCPTAKQRNESRPALLDLSARH